jgi:hypothetical protein
MKILWEVKMDHKIYVGCEKKNKVTLQTIENDDIISTDHFDEESEMINWVFKGE